MNQKKTEKVVFVAPIWNSFPVIITSMLMQTYRHWRLLLIHDGPQIKCDIEAYVKRINDNRIRYIQTPKRLQSYGHPYRQIALEQLGKGEIYPDADYVVITNADNYHTPNYCSRMIGAFKPTLQAVYCNKIVHSYIDWKIINCKLERGYIDCSNIMVRKEAACSVGWRDTKSHSSDWTFIEDIVKKYGMESIGVVDGCLVTHN